MMKLCPQCKHPLTEQCFTEDLEQVCPDCGYVFDEDEALQPAPSLPQVHLDEIRRDLVEAEKAGASPILCDDVRVLIAEVERLHQQVEQLAGALEVMTQ